MYKNQLNIVKQTKRNFTTLLRPAASAKHNKTIQIYKKRIIKLPIFGYEQKPTKYCQTNKKKLYILCYGLRPPLNTAKQSQFTKTLIIQLPIFGYVEKPTKNCKTNKKNL